ncbi:MAG: hypothetical protein EZS28_005774 [Streblomastix strix]|uniref:Uncharacterized protein n=1 Tax=Streblomastix strix TaxID=222440 RepID=A0A5J4WUJ4_9EUKA|nr:MAG: hypothetical protein EZS28_005774 [Streblomastix strix]
MSEQTQQSGSSQLIVADKLGYRSRTKPRNPDIDYNGNKGLVLSYEKYQTSLASQIKDKQDLIDNNDYQRVKEQASKKRNELLVQSKQQSYAPPMDLIVEDINGDKFAEFAVRDNNGFIRSADRLRITVPFKRQKITKYFTENPSRKDGAATHYKSWKEEDKPADGYRHFIKYYLSPFLKERGYTIAQVYSVIGDRIWKGVIAPWLLQYYDKLYQAQTFIGGDGEIPDSTNADGDDIFTIPTEQAIKESKLRRYQKRLREQRSYEQDMTKKQEKKPTFNEGKTLENAGLLPYEFQNDLDDYVIEDQ